MTLVEIMITLIISSIIAASTFMFFAGQQRVYETQTKLLNIQQNIWAAMEILIEFLSFDLDREEFTDPAGALVRAREAILGAVLEIHDDLERLGAARSAGARPVSTWPADGRSPAVAPVADSAADLLDALDEETSDR